MPKQEGEPFDVRLRVFRGREFQEHRRIFLRQLLLKQLLFLWFQVNPKSARGKSLVVSALQQDPMRLAPHALTGFTHYPILP